MNEVGPSLMTTYTFKNGKEYVVKMKVTTFKGCKRNLELSVMDKYTSEEWQSSYDAAYIENLTHKTGNYKHFDVFVAMLQSGLLKTSESITLDLLTLEDLQLLRARKPEGNSCSSLGSTINNRRYLILTYTVEFDRIHYPLPLEYSGLPDPVLLQATIRRLQAEIEKLQSTGVNRDLQKRIQELTITNQRLIQENQKLSGKGTGLRRLVASIKTLENSVAKERTSFRTQIQKLKSENASLLLKVKQLSQSTGRKPGDGSPALKRYTRSPSLQSRCSNHRKSRSRSPSLTGHARTSSFSSGSSLESVRIRRPACRNSKKFNKGAKDSNVDLENLESRIYMLQKMLKEGINLN